MSGIEYQIVTVALCLHNLKSRSVSVGDINYFKRSISIPCVLGKKDSDLEKSSAGARSVLRELNIPSLDYLCNLTFCEEVCKVEVLISVGVIYVKNVFSHEGLLRLDYYPIAVTVLVSVRRCRRLLCRNGKRCRHIGNGIIVSVTREGCYDNVGSNLSSARDIVAYDYAFGKSRNHDRVRIAVVFNGQIIKAHAAHIVGCFIYSPAALVRFKSIVKLIKGRVKRFKCYAYGVAASISSHGILAVGDLNEIKNVGGYSRKVKGGRVILCSVIYGSG